MFAEPDDEEKRVFPLVLHRSLARGRYILWMGKSLNLKGGRANKKSILSSSSGVRRQAAWA